MLVSEICLGTMTFGGIGRWGSMGNLQEEEAGLLLGEALDSGINFIDTANVYSYGESEKILGRAIRESGVNRQDLVLATKVLGLMGEGPNQGGLSRYHMFNSVDASLQRLGTDHIDLLYIHGEDPLTPVEEIMSSLNDLVQSGKVRYLGVCNWSAWMVMKALGISRAQNGHGFQAMQYFYSLACRDAERELIPLALDQHLAFLPWSPLAGGFLTGKFTRDQVGTGTGRRRDSLDFPPIDKEKAFRILETAGPMALDHGVSVAEIALAWVRQKQPVTSTLIGARNLEQLKSNIHSASLDLSSAENSLLDEVSALVSEYPQWMIERLRTQGRKAHRV